MVRYARRGVTGRFDLRGVPGSRRKVRLSEDGSSCYTFCGVIAPDAAPDTHPGHFWLVTPSGRRSLVNPRARPLIETLTGLHQRETLTGTLRHAGLPADLFRRLVRSGWLVELPGVVAIDEFDARFRGFTLTRLPGEVERPDPASQLVRLRTVCSASSLPVPGWLYQHLVGPRMRSDLPDSVAFGITDPRRWVARVDQVLAILPRLLGEQLAALTPAVASSAGRLSQDGARSKLNRRIRPDSDEILEWLIIFLSKV